MSHRLHPPAKNSAGAPDPHPVLQHVADAEAPGQFLANVNSCSCSLYVIVRLSICRLSVSLSVTFVHPTQPIEIFGNVSAPFNTLVT